MEEIAKLQPVEVAGVKMAKKTKGIIAAVAIMFVLCVIGGVGYKVYSDKKAEQEYIESYNAYIDTLESIQIYVLIGGSDAESLCNLTLRVWGNSIYEKKIMKQINLPEKIMAKGFFMMTLIMLF